MNVDNKIESSIIMIPIQYLGTYFSVNCPIKFYLLNKVSITSPVAE